MIGSIGMFSASNSAATALLRSKTNPSLDTTASLPQSVTSSANDEFTNYMKMTPGERMEDNWLKARGLSREKLDALPPKKREAIIKQMKEDLEKKLKDKAEQQTTKINITV